MPHNVWAPRSPVGVASGGPRSFPQLQGGVELSLAHTWLQDKADWNISVATSSCQIGGGVFARREAGPAPSGFQPLGEIWSPPQEADDLPLDLAAAFKSLL